MEAQMVASSGQDPPQPYHSSKVNASLVSPWPDPIDLHHDIFTPGKADTYKSELVAALRSRDLYNTILEMPPTLETIAADNPDADPHDITTVFDAIMHKRQTDNGIIAANILRTVKMTSLSLAHQTAVRAFQAAGDGVSMFEYIWRRIDLSHGEAQDKLRIKYVNTKVSPTDSMATVRKQVDTKWWLFKHHTLYDSTNGQREGIRELNVMLLNGPHIIKLGAIAAIANISESAVVDGDKWVQDWQTTHERYGDLMVGQYNSDPHEGGLMIANGGRVRNEAKELEFKERMAKTNTCAANGGNSGMGCKVWNCQGKLNAGKDCILVTDQELTGVFAKGSQAITNGRAEYKANPKPETARDYVPRGDKPQNKGTPRTATGAGYWFFDSSPGNQVINNDFNYPDDPRSHELYNDSDEDDWDDTKHTTIGTGVNLMMLSAGTGAATDDLAAVPTPARSKRTPIIIKPRAPAVTPANTAPPVSPEAIAALLAATRNNIAPIPIDTSVAPTPPARRVSDDAAPLNAASPGAQPRPVATRKGSWIMPLLFGVLIGVALETVRVDKLTSWTRAGDVPPIPPYPNGPNHAPSMQAILAMLAEAAKHEGHTLPSHSIHTTRGDGLDAPIAPSGNAPIAPSGDAPIAPSGDAPIAASGDAPIAPSGDAPVAPSGDAALAASGEANNTQNIMGTPTNITASPSITTADK